MVNVRISCPVNPSESEQLVLDAVMRIFPDASMSRTLKGFEGTAPSIDNFSKLVRRQMILDAARAVIIAGIRGEDTMFRLNKQAAFVGKVSFSPKGSVLGTIAVRIGDDEDILQLIDEFFPSTVDGQEVRI